MTQRWTVWMNRSLSSPIQVMCALASTVAVPTGRVALVFTDIEGSTRLWERCSAGMRAALELHDRILRTRLLEHSGYEVKTQGDSFMVAFATVRDAVSWCLAVQAELLRAPWPEELLAEREAAEVRGSWGVVHRGLRVRMGVHVGEPECRIDARTGRADYFGRMVNVAARVADAGHGGQVLVSGEAWSRVSGLLEELGRPAVRALGQFRLKGILDPVPLVELLPATLAERRFACLRVAEERRGNMPPRAGDIIGREEELALLRRWFDAGARLVTILGPGGMGKTRLAAHFGSLQQEARRWEGGVWWCDLTAAVSVEDTCHAVGKALGVVLAREGAEGDVVEQLGRALGGRGAVLVLLDNVEQLLTHLPALLGRWCALAPQARFLLTSQEALRIGEERTFDLAPLGLPAEEDTSLEAISRSDAVRLFVERAQLARGHYALTVVEAPLVAEIVRRLDGIALAIELAAAQTQLMGVGQLRERLSHRFELLRSGRRDGVSRQATLRGAIDWSWNLLTPAEQVALAQCSVFRGGFTLEAAEAVLALPPEGADVLETLESLRAKSLLRAFAPEGLPGELRLGMYESIREYAAARLVEVGCVDALVARHADYYLALARALREPVPGGGGEALLRLALERENLLALCDQALAEQPATPEATNRALAALVALEPDVVARGPVGLTLPRLDKALVRAAALPGESPLWLEALSVRGRAHLEAGQLASARRDLEKAREGFRALGGETREKRLLVDLSIVARHEGALAEAWSLLQEALRLGSGEDRWLEAYTLGNLGIVELVRSGAGAAVPHLRAALERFRAVGDTTFEVTFLINTALAIGEAGRTEEAMVLLEEAMVQAMEAGHRAGSAFARLNLGCFLLDAERTPEAREHLEAVVQLGRQLGMRLVEGCARGELGRASLAAGAVEAAEVHLSEAIALLNRLSRWNMLRFFAHLSAVQALRGELPEARKGFAALESEPELRDDPILRELSSLLRAALALARARVAPPGSEEAGRWLHEVRARVERARGAPPAAASSDLRGWLRLLERWLHNVPSPSGRGSG